MIKAEIKYDDVATVIGFRRLHQLRRKIDDKIVQQEGLLIGVCFAFTPLIGSIIVNAFLSVICIFFIGLCVFGFLIFDIYRLKSLKTILDKQLN